MDEGEAPADSIKFTRAERVAYVSSVTKATLLGDIRGGNKGGGDFVRCNVHSETFV